MYLVLETLLPSFTPVPNVGLLDGSGINTHSNIPNQTILRILAIGRHDANDGIVLVGEALVEDRIHVVRRPVDLRMRAVRLKRHDPLAGVFVEV